MSGFEPGPGWREVSFGVACDGGGEVISYRRPGPGNPTYTYWAPVQPLPTEPGNYRTADGRGFILRENRWHYALVGNFAPDEVVTEAMPLLLMEPRAVTAEAVIEQVIDRLSIDGDEALARLHAIAREFGVSA